MRAHFILYVADQTRSRDFYSAVFDEEPTLDVPGMTEFSLGDGSILGLMPEDGIVRLLGSAICNPSSAAGIPRSELYLIVEAPAMFHARAVEEPRDWGHLVAYSLDPDGHVLAFASPSNGPTRS